MEEYKPGIMEKMKSKPSWKKEEVEILLNNYDTMTSKELRGLLPGRSAQSIQTKANRLGLIKMDELMWSDEELKILNDNFYTMSLKEIAELLPKRSYNGVKAKVTELDLQKSKLWTDQENKTLSENHAKPITELMKLLPNRSRSSIIGQLNILGFSVKGGPSGKFRKIYYVWRAMVQRCCNPDNPSYKNYGGRGISVCADWKVSADNFINWAISNGYKDGLSIDRINNDGNYCPENCRWITRKEQQSNTRRCRMITAWGETKTITEWAKDPRCRTSRRELNKHIDRANGSMEEIISR